MLDFVWELIAEIVGDGLEAMVRSPRVPRWLRVVLVTILGGGLCVLCSLLAMQTEDTVVCIVLAAIALGLLVVSLYLILKIVNE